MLRSRTSRWIAAGLAVALVAAAGTALAQDRARDRRERRARAGGMRTLKFRTELKRRGALLKMKRLLDMPEEQARVALEVAREAGAVRAAARDRAAAILVKAFREGREAGEEQRTALRAKVREELKALKEEAKASLLPAGRRALAALTPEQRAKAEEFARARGRTLDEDRLALLLAWRLSKPKAESFLKARLEK